MTALARAAAASSNISDSGVSFLEPTLIKGKWATVAEPGGVRLLARRIAEVSVSRLEASSVSSTPATRGCLPQAASAHSASRIMERSAISQRYGPNSAISTGGLSLAVEGIEAQSTFLRTATTPPGQTHGATPSIWPVAESAVRRADTGPALEGYFNTRLSSRRFLTLLVHAWLAFARRREGQRRLWQFARARIAHRTNASVWYGWTRAFWRRSAVRRFSEDRIVTSTFQSQSRAFYCWRRTSSARRNFVECRMKIMDCRNQTMLKALLWMWRLLSKKPTSPCRRTCGMQTLTPPRLTSVASATSPLLPVSSTSTQCTTSVANAACGSDVKAPSDGRKLAALMALLLWKNRVLNQRLAEAECRSMGQPDSDEVDTATVQQRLASLEAGLLAVQQCGVREAVHPSPILVNGQWYTVHPIEDGDLVPDEGADAGVYVEEAVNGLAERSFGDPPLELLGHQHDCQPQYSIGELLGPEALSPFEEFPKVTYPDENRDDNHSVGLFNVAGAGRQAKGVVGASLESLPSLAYTVRLGACLDRSYFRAPRVILDNFDRTLHGSPSPLRGKLGKAPPPDITLASREGPPLVAQPIAVEAHESISDENESTLIKIDGDDSDLVTPKSPRPGVADLRDDTYALSGDTNFEARELDRDVPSKSIDLLERIEENVRNATVMVPGVTSPQYNDSTGNLRPEYICAVELETWKKNEEAKFRAWLREQEASKMRTINEEYTAKELTRQREFVEKMKSLAALEGKLKKKATDLEQREVRILSAEESLQKEKDGVATTLRRRDEEHAFAQKRLVTDHEHALRLQAEKTKIATKRASDAEARIVELQKKVKEAEDSANKAHKTLQSSNMVQLQADVKVLKHQLEQAAQRELLLAKSRDHFRAAVRQLCNQLDKQGVEVEEVPESESESDSGASSAGGESERIRRLEAQKQSLLDTGVYTARDATIQALDDQIARARDWRT
ncbi:hypothetical protein FOL47_001211 [Perkinsus chesapeaki]|uniref:Uncharacterized protein n=1 Tax=Perkinsus chesapeaki TaxID=330153 RepID=A0A7J6MJV8_PERCH|nr:hypothetical protein FOL47_001211 [Perkinsus chesapeaki]